VSLSVPLTLAAVDAVGGLYLVAYAIRRERRDKPAVLVVGVFLLACAAALLVVGWPAGEVPPPSPPPLPAPTGEPV
jgi:cytochrome c oxidase assembly factor CtaG